MESPHPHPCRLWTACLCPTVWRPELQTPEKGFKMWGAQVRYGLPTSLLGHVGRGAKGEGHSFS